MQGKSVGEMLATTGASEIAEWIYELGTLRPEDERAAYEQAEKDAEKKAGR